MLKEAIAVLMVLGVVSATDYCSVCTDHTMCLYDGIGPACHDVGEGGVTKEEIADIVKTHNDLRKKVAKGLESRGNPGPQPKASNMMKLVWNKELAKIAQRWADQCTFQHDSCRKVDTTEVGQNIFWSYIYPAKKEANWTQAIMSWYNEVQLYDSSGVSSYKHDPATGHYTQIVWAETSSVGCGRRNYGPNKIYVCNYSPSGNWIGRPVYVTGDPCSNCPPNTDCKNGLCERKATASFKKTKLPGKKQIMKDSFQTEYEESTTTELPIDFNIIDDLDVHDDEEIKREIEDLRTRIRQLVEKIIGRRNARN